jgi:hypothetical protein
MARFSGIARFALGGYAKGFHPVAHCSKTTSPYFSPLLYIRQEMTFISRISFCDLNHIQYNCRSTAILRDLTLANIFVWGVYTPRPSEFNTGGHGSAPRPTSLSAVHSTVHRLWIRLWISFAENCRAGSTIGTP